MVKQLHADGLDLSAVWSDAEFAALLDDDDASTEKENAVIEPGPTDIQRGELILLGRHRILCGDARTIRKLSRALGGSTVVAKEPTKPRTAADEAPRRPGWIRGDQPVAADLGDSVPGDSAQ